MVIGDVTAGKDQAAEADFQINDLRGSKVMNRRHFFKSSVAAAVAASVPTGNALSAALAALTTVEGDVAAVTGAGAAISLDKAAVTELADSLRGRLLLPGNEGYDAARSVLNFLIDKHPALIVQPTGAADVMNAVTFARENNLLLAVKCGGHSHSGKSTCDGGMQIDLSTLRSAHVDAGRREAYIGGGSLLGELDHEAMAHGLVTTAGTVSHTGVGGLTLGGGFGRLGRRFGLALDNVMAASIVTADGQLRRVSAEQEPDLYWALRGGGGNFGVVTEFEFKLHPMQRQVIGGEIVFPFDKARDVLNLFADYSMTAPDDLYLDFGMGSPLGSSDGYCMLHACYSGPAEKAEKVLAPLRKIGGEVKDGLVPIDYVAMQRAYDQDPTDPRTSASYMKSGFLKDFDGKLIDALLDNIQATPDFGASAYFQHSGGAIGRVADDATAFAHRYSTHNMMASAQWPVAGDSSQAMSFLREYWSEIGKFTDGWYTVGVDNESAQAVNANYRGNYPRLVTIKKQYDPSNLFRLNANVKPGA